MQIVRSHAPQLTTNKFDANHIISYHVISFNMAYNCFNLKPHFCFDKDVIMIATLMAALMVMVKITLAWKTVGALVDLWGVEKCQIRGVEM